MVKDQNVVRSERRRCRAVQVSMVDSRDLLEQLQTFEREDVRDAGKALAS